MRSEMSTLSASLQGLFYKGTRHSDFVVRRQISVCEDRLCTLHPDKSSRGYKSWYLDSECRLQPSDAKDITRHQKLIRPPRKWTAVAAFQGRGEPIELFCFKVVWPKHHAKLLLGFADQVEAQLWHAQIQEQIKFVYERCARQESLPNRMC